MSVLSVNGGSSAALMQWLASQNTPPGSPSGSTSSLLASDTSSVGISHLSKFLSRLDDVAASDPEKFKSMMSDIATKLSAAAGNETGEVSNSLRKIAEQFRQAAETGTTDPLRQDASAGDSYTSYTQSSTATDRDSLLQLFASGSADTPLSGQWDGLLQSLLNPAAAK